MSNDFNASANDFYHHYIDWRYPHFAPPTSAFIPYMPTRPVAKITPTDTEAKNNALAWDLTDFQPQGPELYIATPGDTLLSIAQKKYGEPELAELLALMNGLPSFDHELKAGHRLWIPPLVNNYNKANHSRPYQEFLSIITGSLSPILKLPKPKSSHHQHHQFLGILLKVVAVGIVLLSAPYLANALLGIVGGSLSQAALAGTSYTIGESIAVGVTAALSDAALQGLAVACHFQPNFSLTESLEVGVTAGSAPLINANAGAIKSAHLQTIATRALKVAMLQASTQLIEMGAGLRTKFDANDIAFQVSASIANLEMDEGIKTQLGTGKVAKTVGPIATASSNAILGNAITQASIDVKNVAAHALGTAITQEADELATSQRQDIDEAEAIAKMRLDDPKLDLAGSHYGNESYALSEMNRKMAANDSSNSKLNPQDTRRGFFMSMVDKAKEDLSAVKWAINNPRDAAAALKSNLEANLDSYGNPHLFQTKMQAQANDFDKSVSGIYNDMKEGNFDSLGRLTEVVGTALFPFGKVAGLAKLGFFARTAIKGAGNEVIFELAPRVGKQLTDPRLGSLAGKLDAKKLNELVGNPEAQFIYDTGTGNINVIQRFNGKLLRITTPPNSFKIISVGPIQERNIINSIKNGRFLPIGRQLEESAELNTYMSRLRK